MSAAFDAQSTHPLSSDKPYVLELMGELRAGKAAQVAASLRTAINNYPMVVISLDEVTDIDISVLKLLISAEKMAALCGRTISLKSPASGALQELLSRQPGTGE
jgi:anti-anti-sigma regulatory factor